MKKRNNLCKIKHEAGEKIHRNKDKDKVWEGEIIKSRKFQQQRKVKDYEGRLGYFFMNY